MEPERQIEKLLRASARKRREESGAPKELHPATRRLLQAEVARRPAAKPREENFFLTVYHLLRPRLVVVLCVVAAGILGASLLLPPLGKTKSKSMLAANKTPDVRLAKAADEAPASAPSDKPATPLPARAPLEFNVSNVEKQKALETETGVAAPAAANREILNVASAGEEQKKANNELAAAPPPAKGGFGGGGGGGIGGAGGLRLEQSVTPSKSGERSIQEPGKLELYARGDRAAIGTTTNGLDLARAAGQASSGLSGAKDDVATRRTQTLTDSSAVNAPGTPISGTLAEAGDQFSTGFFRQVTQASSPSNAFAPQQQFVNTASQALSQAKTFNSPQKAVPVLNNFNVVQRGAEIQVVDEDGSVYSGFVQSTNVVQAVVPAATVSAARAGAIAQDMRAQAATASQNYFFIVSGTNRSLKQSVQFSGNLVASGSEAQLNWPTNAQAQSRLQGASNLQEVPLGNYRIDGTAVLDNNQRFQINAVPAPPSPQ